MQSERSEAESFRSVPALVSGVLGLVLVALVVVFGLVDAGADFPVWGLALCGLIATLLWTAMVRPRLQVRGDELELRGMVDTVTVPLAGISELVVRQVLALRVGERSFRSSAVGRGLRQQRRDDGSDLALDAAPSYGGRVEARLLRIADDARAKRGIRRFSKEQDALESEVRRVRSVPLLALLILFGVVFAITAVLGI